jgi:hypothetical protein
MDERQYYLHKIVEEATEVATAAMKCILFGNKSLGPNTFTNDEHLDVELHDLEGAIIAANRKGYILQLPRDTERHLRKADKIDSYLELCKHIKTVK